MDVALPIYEGRASKEPHWFDTWPGEHYRLLAALVRTLNPKTVIEIGTFTGMGTLALAQELQPSGTLTTFDLLAWNSFADTWLAPSDFAGRPRAAGAARHLHAGRHRAASRAVRVGRPDLCRWAQGRRTEANILANLGTLNLSRDVVIVFDDIRVVNMIDIWRRIGRPKMDLTSFGHWSGTGLIDWNGTSDL
jgi:hypothetical protein